MRLVLASNNAKKLVELRALMAGLPVALVAQGDLAVGEAAEPFHTFVENALAKARHAATASGCAALADDSGLCVDALAVWHYEDTLLRCIGKTAAARGDDAVHRARQLIERYAARD